MTNTVGAIVNREIRNVVYANALNVWTNSGGATYKYFSKLFLKQKKNELNFCIIHFYSSC